MIKFQIHPKIYEGRDGNLGKCGKNVKIIGFFHFLGQLNKMKDNLDQECVRGTSILPGQNWNNCS